MSAYYDDQGEIVRVAPGLGEGIWIVKRGSHRLKSPSLPPRTTRAQCQADLHAYAVRRGWMHVEMDPA